MSNRKESNARRYASRTDEHRTAINNRRMSNRDAINARQRILRANYRTETNNRRIANRHQLSDDNRENRNVFFKCAISGPLTFNYPAEHDLGLIDKVCEFIKCGAVHFQSEKGKMLHSCCHNGKVFLPVVENYPPEFRELLMGNDKNCKNFREFIRQYNSANAFASFGANQQNITGYGPYCFKISGEIYHQATTSLTTNEPNQIPSYAQLYIFDSDKAVETRMQNAANKNCVRDIMLRIDLVLRRVSPYGRQYKNLSVAVAEEEERMARTGLPIRDIRLLFTRWKSDDPRRYNAPSTADEVACVFVADRDGSIPGNIDIAVYPKSEQTCRRINKLSRHVNPMVFVLLFPLGEPGWTTGMLHDQNFATNTRNTITQNQYYAHKISIRRQVFNPIHLAGKLFQQFIVHAYVMIESERLSFLRNNQKQLRVESYKGLLDHMSNLVQNSNSTVGNLYILPSTFVGGPRYMNKLYQDSMAIVRQFGRPDLFVTFTCNSKWKEITRELYPWQNASDRPDLVVKVFQLKVEEFLRDVINRGIFGKVIAYVYTIEEQKRGLPHLHSLFTLKEDDKFRTAEKIDSVVSAEIPDFETNPELHQIICKNNIHGPCGSLNPNSICMVNGSCSKNFPKPLREETDSGVNGYPLYKRSDNSSKNYFVRELPINNTFVVPYNAYLSAKFNAHINVEICTSVVAVKYIHKYLTKGHDCARIEIVQNETTTVDTNGTIVQHDEIKNFLNCRYVSPPEAAWRLFENSVHGQSHTIYALSVHLPDGQMLFFNEGQEEEAVRRAATQDTTLTAWFELNRTDFGARDILYQNIPNLYTFSNNKKWHLRKRGGNKVIGRIVAISPRYIELYHLRLLLLNVKGATSFENLRTINNVEYPTYRDAARELGLIEDDLEWKRCMTEGSLYMMPNALRVLFVMILIHCFPSFPLDLWNGYKTQMSEDYVHQGFNEQTAILVALRDINTMLENENSSCTEHGLPEPPLIHHDIVSPSIVNFANENLEGEQMLRLLNEEQFNAAKTILTAALPGGTPINCCFFIDGPGGAGKTFLYKAIIHILRGRQQNVLSVAWTGIAATLLPGGVTCHSAFNLPLDMINNKSCRLSLKNKNILRKTDVIIWDEAPMAPAEALEMVDQALRDLMANEQPFGGKILVLGGDFRQVLPVVRNASRGQIVSKCLKISPLWNLFKIFQLKINMRAREQETEFATWVLNMGDGKLPNIANAKSDTSIALLNNCISDNLIIDIFGEQHKISDAENFSKRAILCPTNKLSQMVNLDILGKLEGDAKVYRSIDMIKNTEEQINFPVEFLNTINLPGLPLHEMELKVGAIVMLLRNLSIDKGLCNGTRLIVRSLSANVIQVEVITGANTGNIYFLPRITLDTSSDVSIPFNFSRRQFPIKLAYALTINKAQGQTFDKVGIFLQEPVFTHGQLYVACSRVRSMDSLKLQIVDGPKQGKCGAETLTDNIVYTEIL